MTDRGTQLADAALRVIARSGLRGLTHRAVDAEARLPAGSTSNVFRSREELLAGAGARLIENDVAAWGGRPLRLPADVGELAAALAEVTVGICRRDPDLLRARFAVFTGDAAAFTGHHRLLMEELARMLAELGVPEADRRARAVADLLDGVMLHAVTVRAGEDLDEQGLAGDLRALLER